MKREKTLLMKIYFKDKEVEELERELRDLEHEINSQQGMMENFR